jgi:hypothetical protein
MFGITVSFFLAELFHVTAPGERQNLIVKATEIEKP